jgi:hypothetical protein
MALIWSGNGLPLDGSLIGLTFLYSNESPMAQHGRMFSQLIIDSGFYLYLEAIPFIDMQMSHLLTVLRRMLRENIF